MWKWSKTHHANSDYFIVSKRRFSSNGARRSQVLHAKTFFLADDVGYDVPTRGQECLSFESDNAAQGDPQLVFLNASQGDPQLVLFTYLDSPASSTCSQ